MKSWMPGVPGLGGGEILLMLAVLGSLFVIAMAAIIGARFLIQALKKKPAQAPIRSR
jgi:hypothetical protein